MRSTPLAIGLVLGGIVIGWLAHGILAPAAPAPPPLPPRIEAPKEAPGALSPPPAEPGPAVEAPPAPARGPAEEPRESPQALLERARAAIGSGDSEVFWRAVNDLCRRRGEEAERALLALLEDPALPVPLRGREFLGGLWRSALPGIAAAARRRFEANLEAGETSWVGADGWLDLVARHGDDADMQWLAARKESTQIEMWALAAIFSSPVEAARRMSRSLSEAGVKAFGGPPGYLRYDAEEGLRIAERALPFLDTSRGSHGRGPDLLELFRAWGAGAPPEDFPELTTFLLSLREPMHRVVAVYAVQALHLRKADTQPLAGLLLDPVLVLERRQPESGLSAAGNAIEHNRVAWSERAAAALEAAGFANEAKKVRAGLASPWKED